MQCEHPEMNKESLELPLTQNSQPRPPANKRRGRVVRAKTGGRKPPPPRRRNMNRAASASVWKTSGPPPKRTSRSPSPGPPPRMFNKSSSNPGPPQSQRRLNQTSSAPPPPRLNVDTTARSLPILNDSPLLSVDFSPNSTRKHNMGIGDCDGIMYSEHFDHERRGSLDSNSSAESAEADKLGSSFEGGQASLVSTPQDPPGLSDPHVSSQEPPALSDSLGLSDLLTSRSREPPELSDSPEFKYEEKEATTAATAVGLPDRLSLLGNLSLEQTESVVVAPPELQGDTSDPPPPDVISSDIPPALSPKNLDEIQKAQEKQAEAASQTEPFQFPPSPMPGQKPPPLIKANSDGIASSNSLKLPPVQRGIQRIQSHDSERRDGDLSLPRTVSEEIREMNKQSTVSNARAMFQNKINKSKWKKPKRGKSIEKEGNSNGVPPTSKLEQRMASDPSKFPPPPVRKTVGAQSRDTDEPSQMQGAEMLSSDLWTPDKQEEEELEGLSSDGLALDKSGASSLPNLPERASIVIDTASSQSTGSLDVASSQLKSKKAPLKARKSNTFRLVEQKDTVRRQSVAMQDVKRTTTKRKGKAAELKSLFESKDREARTPKRIISPRTQAAVFTFEQQKNRKTSRRQSAIDLELANIQVTAKAKNLSKMFENIAEKTKQSKNVRKETLNGARKRSQVEEQNTGRDRGMSGLKQVKSAETFKYNSIVRQMNSFSLQLQQKLTDLIDTKNVNMYRVLRATKMYSDQASTRSMRDLDIGESLEVVDLSVLTRQSMRSSQVFVATVQNTDGTLGYVKTSTWRGMVIICPDDTEVMEYAELVTEFAEMTQFVDRKFAETVKNNDPILSTPELIEMLGNEFGLQERQQENIDSLRNLVSGILPETPQPRKDSKPNLLNVGSNTKLQAIQARLRKASGDRDILLGLKNPPRKFSADPPDPSQSAGETQQQGHGAAQTGDSAFGGTTIPDEPKMIFGQKTLLRDMMQANPLSMGHAIGRNLPVGPTTLKKKVSEHNSPPPRKSGSTPKPKPPTKRPITASSKKIGWLMGEINSSPTLPPEPPKKKKRIEVADVPPLGFCVVQDIVERVTHPEIPPQQYKHVLFLSHSAYISTSELLALFMERYLHPNVEQYFINNESEELRQEFRPKLIQRTRIKVGSVLKYWMKQFSYDFHEESVRQQAEEVFREIDKYSEKLGKQLLDALEGTIKIKQDLDPGARLSLSWPKPKIRHGDLLDVNVMNISSLEMARQLCLLDYNLFKKIKPREFIGQNWVKRKHLSPNVVAHQEHFNKLNFWVQQNILSQVDDSKRAKMFGKLLKIGNHLRNLNNLSSLGAINAALQASAIYRLKRTKARLRNQEAQWLAEFQQLFTTTGNYKALRGFMSTMGQPAIPYLAISFTDLTFIEDGNPSEKDGLINMKLYSLQADPIANCLMFQQYPFNFQYIPEIHDYFEKTMKYLPEDFLYTLSLQVEPREPR